MLGARLLRFLNAFLRVIFDMTTFRSGSFTLSIELGDDRMHRADGEAEFALKALVVCADECPTEDMRATLSTEGSTTWCVAQLGLGRKALDAARMITIWICQIQAGL